jgi:hypothetical protein
LPAPINRTQFFTFLNQHHPDLFKQPALHPALKGAMKGGVITIDTRDVIPLPIALSKVKPSTCRKLIAKVVEQEEKYWAEDEQLYEHDFDEISDDEKCTTD